MKKQYTPWIIGAAVALVLYYIWKTKSAAAPAVNAVGGQSLQSPQATILPAPGPAPATPVAVSVAPSVSPAVSMSGPMAGPVASPPISVSPQPQPVNTPVSGPVVTPPIVIGPVSSPVVATGGPVQTIGPSRNTSPIGGVRGGTGAASTILSSGGISLRF